MQTDTVVKHDWRGVLKDVGWPIKAAVGLVLLSGLFALVAHESSYVLAAPLALQAGARHVKKFDVGILESSSAR